jgi:hypothetical protein
MRWSAMLISSILLVALLSGCQEARLRDRTLMQAGGVNDLYYYQSLNNLAMMHANPGTIPYFSLPNQGTNQNQRTLSATYTPGWDFISAKGVFIARWLFDKNTGAFAGTAMNGETWQTQPTNNPDKINLLKIAYYQTMGLPLTPDDYDAMARFNKNFPTAFKYFEAFKPGWYKVGCCRDVPKDACYVGHCGKTYVWVERPHVADLSDFSLALLDIVTATPKQGEPILPPLSKVLAAKLAKIKEDSGGDPAKQKMAILEMIKNCPLEADVVAKLKELVKQLGTMEESLKKEHRVWDSTVTNTIIDDFTIDWQNQSKATADPVLQQRSIPAIPYPAPPAALPNP